MKKIIFLTFISIAIWAVSLWCADSIKEIPLEQVKNVMNQAPQAHPRLFISEQQVQNVMKKIGDSNDLKILHNTMLQQANELIGKKPLERTFVGRRLLSVSVKALKRIFIMGWAYQSTGDEKYLKRAEKEMLAIAKFTDWNPAHFLDVAEMTTALAVGYDWLYNDLSDKSRNIIRQAISEKGLKPSLVDDEDTMWWIDCTHNWNQVCHGGLICGALVIMEDEPELAQTIIHRSVNKVQIAMHEYEPDGAYPEGAGYWSYGTIYNIMLLLALDSALGDNFGLSEKKGFAKTAEYYLHMAGPTGDYFNYGDNSARQVFMPAVFWFAENYKNSSLTWHQQQILKDGLNKNPSDLLKDRLAVLSLLWINPETSKPQNLSWCGHGLTPVAMFRSSWDKDAVYLAIKGGTPKSNHGHMDVGSFVIDADGVRWALDLAAENYTRIEALGLDLWNKEQDSDRWKIFRYNNYSHSTLTVNNQFQQVSGYAPITEYVGDGDSPHVVIDMTEVYEGQLKKAVRSASLLPSGQIIIWDTLQATDQSATIRWTMTTPARIDITSDTTAILSQKQKKMQFHVVTESDIKLTTYSTEPPASYDSANPDTRMIGFEVNLFANESVRIAVFMAADSGKNPVNVDFYDIERWKIKTK